MSFLAILEVLNFDFSKFEHFSNAKFTKIQGSVSRIAKNNIYGPFEFANIWLNVKSERR